MWQSPAKETYFPDPEAVLFNLTLFTSHKCKTPKMAIKCKANWGPRFGDDELYAVGPFNEANMCHSYINNDGYGICKDKEGRNELTDLKCGIPLYGIKSDFTISELEVWQLTFGD